MKTCPSSQERAVALITTLILVSAITLVTISVLTISQNETKISGSRISNTRADLAERAAFEEAKNLLLALTRNDDYVVTSVMERSGPSGSAGMRYTFISTPAQGSVSHAALFAGGNIESTSLSNLDEMDTSALADAPIGRPNVNFTTNEKAKLIEAFGLTHLSDDGRMIPEDRFPETGLIEMESDPRDKFKMRYTWWAEDLEGYPNIDVVGAWTDHYGNNDFVAIDFIRPGYPATDPRTLPNTGASPFGLRIPVPGDDYFAWQFPKSFRGQQLAGQVAPGLSPREIILQPWATSQIPLRAHPFAGGTDLSTARHWLSSGGAYTHSSMTKREHRFMVGLHSYLSVPRIPYNHGYIDAGQPRHNLNALIANRIVSNSGANRGIANIIGDNLETFEDLRKGGFPSDLDYLATLAANAIDYADADSNPTGPNSSTCNGSGNFRGVDSYCPINEFFVKFNYEGYIASDETITFRFLADCYGEFWNTSNQPVRMTGLKLDFEFLDDPGFRYSTFTTNRARLSEDTIVMTKAGEVPIEDPSDTELIPPNQYYVHYFGRRRWEVDVPAAEIPPIERPTVQELQAYVTGKSSARATYRLSLPDGSGNLQVVDSCGRPDTPPLPPSSAKHGFFFNKHTGVLNQDSPIIRVAAGNLGVTRKDGTSPKMSGSHLGDPWMSFYTRSTVDNSGNGGSEYRNRATPGFRNFDHSKVNHSDRKNVIKDQTRVRDWPDGGFDNGVPSSTLPDDDEQLPDQFNPAPGAPERFDRNRAPFQISNEGVFFSVSELGNLRDPVMWSSVPLDLVAPSSLALRYEPKDNSPNYFRDYPAEFRDSFSNPDNAGKHSLWGGGNTLRIGRAEHPLFDVPGARASQLLDLFQVGHPGTNLKAVEGSGVDLYESYDPRDHQPPPAAADATAAMTPPFNRIYDERLHAQGIFQKRHGHLNINSVPTVFEIETLLRGPFASCEMLRGAPTPDDHITPEYASAAVSGSLENALKADAIPLIARGLYEARPFYSPSHLARVLSELIRRHEALPEVCNDAAAEETFARVFNTTSFSSRHFRIFTEGEVLSKANDVVLSRSKKIYEVFMEPEHDSAGNIVRVTTRIMSIRDL
ncbi:hypothetical protein VSU19_00790 [Verrucomicrobiales bacterium BCK34]|nr:hypothetical protein [Verrucomicrobiales bacterium BCK34]